MRRRTTLRELEVAFAELVDRAVEAIAEERGIDAREQAESEMRHILMRQVEELCLAWCRRMQDQAILAADERSWTTVDPDRDLDEVLDELASSGTSTLH